MISNGGTMKKPFIVFLIFILTFSFNFQALFLNTANAVSVEAPRLVKDILPAVDEWGNAFSGDPDNLIALGNTLFFSADDGTNGRELWKSDGTALGTVMVKDINSFTDEFGGIFSSSPQNLTVFDSTLYFIADDGINGTELWKSDGTANGTVMVEDIFVGPNGSWPANLTVFDNLLYFSADDGTNGRELWRTDGTSIGTEMVADVWEGINGGMEQENFVVFDGRLYFVAQEGTNGRELWRTNGTAIGTEMVADIWPGVDGFEAPFSSIPNRFMALGGNLYFSADDGVGGRELWRFNETQGVLLVKDILVGPIGGIGSENFVALGNSLYFDANNGENGTELWKSNGTAEGTMMVKDIRLVGDGFCSWCGFIAFNNNLYFGADDGVSDTELWKSDGTEAGTIMVEDNRENSGSSPEEFTVFNNYLYYTYNDGVHRRELWRTDGTPEGTIMVSDIYGTIEGWNSSSSPENLTVVGNTLFFSANDGINGRELWALDGPITPETPPTPDTTPPVFTNFPGSTDGINITEGQFITTNPYTIKVRPEDDGGIQKVEFYVDNNLLCTDTTADPNGIYSCDWDTAKFNSTVRVVAFDNANNTAQLTRNTTVDPRLYLRILPKAGRG